MPAASVTAATAVTVEVPFALRDPGMVVTVTRAASPAGLVWSREALPETLGLTELSVAEMVAMPGVVEDVTVVT